LYMVINIIVYQLSLPISVLQSKICSSLFAMQKIICNWKTGCRSWHYTENKKSTHIISQ
jgi:hypothetical protein